MIRSLSPRQTRLLLGLFTGAIVVTAVILSRSGWTGPAAPDAKEVSITALRAFGAMHPRLSPDGKTIAFSYQGNIWRMAVKSSAMKRLTAGGGHATEPCWSPDGKSLAFLQGAGWGSGQVKIIDAQTGADLPLAKPVFGSGKLYFAPDGQQLLGYLRGRTQIESFRSMDLKTGELKTILRQPSRRQPWALSADGKWLAFTTPMDQPEQQSGNNGPQVDVWKASVEKGEPQKITQFPARIHGLCWSADGQSLLASTELGGVHNDLYRISLNDPQRPIKLTHGQADEDEPSVSADGRWLLYSDNREGCPALVLRNLSSGEEQTLSVERLDFSAPVGRLRLQVTDKSTNKKTIARISLQHKDGSYPAPPGSLWRLHRTLAHFYVDGQTEFDLPAGSYRLRGYHGPEHRVVQAEIEVQPGKTTEQVVMLERWVDANSKGWYSGDNHIHANYGYGEYYNNQRDMAVMCGGEGLNVCNFMVANSDGDGVFDREFFRGRPDTLSTSNVVLYWNEEFRSTIWGHMTLVNLTQLVEPIYTGFKDTTNPHDIPSMSEIADRTHLQKGIVNYTHPSARIDDLYRGAYTAKGLPIYAALGKIDTMDVMGSNDRASTALYHGLLNCGIRLTASAGTDCFLNRIRSFLPGAERVYVKVEGPFSYDKWIEGLRAGRSFASNGPILDLSVEGMQIGGEVRLRNAKTKVRVQGMASSQYPLDRIEVLYNGQVVETIKPAKEGHTTEVNRTIVADRSGWIALRVSGPEHPDVEGPWVYAHTSPVYVAVEGKSAGSAKDAQYFLEWIDRLWAEVEARDRIPSPRLKAQVKAQVDQARGIYRRIIEQNKDK